MAADSGISAVKAASSLRYGETGSRRLAFQLGADLAMASLGDRIVPDDGRARQEEDGREASGYLVMDVREEPEIAASGKLSPNTLTFPLQKLMQYNAFSLEEDEFEEIFGFEKPTPDETLVFSCAAGVRSVHAAQFAAQGTFYFVKRIDGIGRESLLHFACIEILLTLSDKNAFIPDNNHVCF